MEILEITMDNFKAEVLDSDKPVLVDFWAVWCGPCRMLSPIIDEVAAENDGSVKFCKVNVDEAGELAELYNVASIPTLIVFKNGEPAASTIGVVPKTKILELIGV